MKKHRVEPLKAIGRSFRPLLQDGTRPVEFIGRVAAEFPPLLRHGMRARDFAYYMNLCGVQALPIVLLICFLMGMVMAVNGQIQLSKLGQEIYVVDAVGFVVLKELGPLMVAMVLTGWAGSAFAAEIGTMKLDEQVSALETMGIRPESFLVFPKLAAMLISMPVLTIFGNVAGIAGGMVIGVVRDPDHAGGVLLRIQRGDRRAGGRARRDESGGRLDFPGGDRRCAGHGSLLVHRALDGRGMA